MDVPSADVSITATDPPVFFETQGRRLASDIRIDFVVSAPQGTRADLITESLTRLVEGDTDEVKQFVDHITREIGVEIVLAVVVSTEDLGVTTSDPEADALAETT